MYREPLYIQLDLLVQTSYSSELATPCAALSFMLLQDRKSKGHIVGPTSENQGVPDAKQELAEGRTGMEQR